MNPLQNLIATMSIALLACAAVMAMIEQKDCYIGAKCRPNIDGVPCSCPTTGNALGLGYNLKLACITASWKDDQGQPGGNLETRRCELLCPKGGLRCGGKTTNCNGVTMSLGEVLDVYDAQDLTKTKGKVECTKDGVAPK